MFIYSNKTLKSLEKLAYLLDISIDFGWKKKLADWLSIEAPLLSLWIKRNNIPKKQRQKIAERGYPETDWYIKAEEYSEISGQIPGKFVGEDLSDEECHLIMAIRELDPLRREGIYLSVQVGLNAIMQEYQISKDKMKMEFLEKAKASIDKLKAAV